MLQIFNQKCAQTITCILPLLLLVFLSNAAEESRLDVVGISPKGDIIVTVPFQGHVYPVCLFSAFLERPKNPLDLKLLTYQLRGLTESVGKNPKVDLEFSTEDIAIDESGVCLFQGRIFLVDEDGAKTDLVSSIISSGTGTYNGTCEDAEYDALLKASQVSAKERGVGLWQETKRE